MSLSLTRLKQLKRQAGSAARAVPALPSSSGPNLHQLRNLLRTRSVAPAPTTYGDRTLPGVQVAPDLHLVEEFLTDPTPTEFDGSFDRGESIAAEDLLFFDTETTGLAGGTGTRAFMIGAADWYGGRLRIRQVLMATTAAEPAMLDLVANWVHSSTVLCSYNGKCYDAPLLATRYRLARRPHPLMGLRHVDLLYPTRRRYRGVHENCRLATIERKVLQVVREDDLPGSEAPAAWLGYLRGGDAGMLRRVVAHNRQDVISLSRLLKHLSELGPVIKATA